MADLEIFQDGSNADVDPEQNIVRTLPGVNDNDKGTGLLENDPSSGSGKRIHLAKLIVLVTIPFILLICITLYHLDVSMTVRDEIYLDSDIVIRSANLGELIHMLQRERDQSVLFQSTISPQTKTYLTKSYLNTDTTLSSIPWPKNLDRQGRPEYTSRSSFQMHLLQHRNGLELQVNTIFDEMDFYTNSIKTLMLWLNDALSESRSSDLWKSLVAYENVIYSKEAAGIERTLGGYFFSNGGFDSIAQYILFVRQGNAFLHRYSSARKYSKVVPPLSKSDIMVGDEDVFNVIQRYRGMITNSNITDTSLHLAFDWFDAMSLYIDHLFDIQKQIKSTLVNNIQALAKAKLTPIVMCFCVLVVLSSVYPLVIRAMCKITNNLKSNATTLVDNISDLQEEKMKSNDLLYQMVPLSVADQLKRNGAVSAEYFRNVTVFFSDVVGFTSMTKNLPPMHLVNLLTNIYNRFDDKIDKYDVYRVESVGDSFMVTSGLPEFNERHASIIADLALDIMEDEMNVDMPGQTSMKLHLRIGIHSGPVMAGVVGHKLPRYCVFGDTVNTSSRMETSGLPDKIHISSRTNQLLAQTNEYWIESRGAIDVKGKGEMLTYFLVGTISPNGARTMCNPNASEGLGCPFDLHTSNSVVQSSIPSVETNSTHETGSQLSRRCSNYRSGQGRGPLIMEDVTPSPVPYRQPYVKCVSPAPNDASIENQEVSNDSG